MVWNDASNVMQSVVCSTNGSTITQNSTASLTGSLSDSSAFPAVSGVNNEKPVYIYSDGVLGYVASATITGTTIAADGNDEQFTTNMSDEVMGISKFEEL
jgi:hypothetical protein